jgi:hypothetical protein
MPTKERTPKPFTRTCEGCGIEYIAFRKTSRFHSGACRRKHSHDKSRQAILEKYHHECADCPPSMGKPYKLFLRVDPRGGGVKPFCGHHNGKISRWMYENRVFDL